VNGERGRKTVLPTREEVSHEEEEEAEAADAEVTGGPGARTICWFSAGAPSAVATKLTLAETPDAEVVYIDTGSEDDDNPRFIADCARWFGKPVQVIRSDEYEDTWDCWERTRYLVGPDGARCTTEMKKVPRYKFERPDDVHVFGYTADAKDAARSVRWVDQNPGYESRFPLIERGLYKADCLELILRAGIELPRMYRLGYENNNCVGCPKGGMGYWNRIRVTHPHVFAKMALLERDVNHACNSEEITPGSRAKTPVWLDELDPDRGDFKADQPSCSFTCASIADELAPVSSREGDGA
jgi:3'-phosphoadenosine 5'-phosphosulfate sulfotransferase (PAPS reductase)/FAD synthetase